MKSANGAECNIDGVTLEFFGASLVAPITLSARVGLCNSKSGAVYSRTICSTWSTKTADLIKELISSMEEDALNQHFNTADAINSTEKISVQPPPGITTTERSWDETPQV